MAINAQLHSHLGMLTLHTPTKLDIKETILSKCKDTPFVSAQLPIHRITATGFLTLDNYIMRRPRLSFTPSKIRIVSNSGLILIITLILRPTVRLWYRAMPKVGDQLSPLDGGIALMF